MSRASGRLGSFLRLRRASFVVAALGVAAAFSSDGRAAPFTNPNAATTADNLGVVPLAPAPAGANATGALALAALDRRIADLDAEETSAKHELADMAAKIAEAHGRSMGRGRAFYRLTRAGMLPVGGGFDALVTHALRVERARRALAADLEAEKKLRARGGELSRTLERIARDRVAYGSQRSSMDAARLAVEDEARRSAAFDRAFSQSSGASEFVAVGGGNGTGEGGRASTGFSLSKGRLLFPIVGRTEVRAAQREGTTGPGLEIRSSIGAGVRATHAGRVAFAERYGPYGRLVILDHGDHYFTVSANLASILVKVGDEVSAGERIGTVGDEGKGPMLYFEVRHGTETMAPGPWLGI
ncbi:MAG: peptidoglycan DD-metalloendopeptidase family protein [Deltaproteobacteria bacterium]|nr:peptidoglycan DD-metalloendopeptidase family protein [Deltaproteobacteria bacterium]